MSIGQPYVYSLSLARRSDSRASPLFFSPLFFFVFIIFLFFLITIVEQQGRACKVSRGRTAARAKSNENVELAAPCAQSRAAAAAASTLAAVGTGP